MQTTLVIGTYNPNKEWLQEAIQSSEGLFDETIIVDDGSDEKIEQATVTHETNKGFYQARNTGCSLAQGEWIVSLDDDDIFIRENVVELLEVIKTTDAEIITFPIELFGSTSGLWAEQPSPQDILNTNQFPSGSWFRKSVWEELQGFQISTAEDWDFWARATKSKKRILHFTKPIYRHRIRVDSISSQWTGEKFLSIREQIIKNYNLWQPREAQ